VTETRKVEGFNAVRAKNGVHVFLATDANAGSDVQLEVTTDSNLQEFLSTNVSGDRLTVTSERVGGVTPTHGFDVSGTVAAIESVSADNGARVEITGSADEVTLSANNGARLVAESFEADTVEVDADNGAQVTVCATGEVTGDVKNGAQLTVFCGGSVRVETSDGGRVSSVALFAITHKH
jgi:hypothetical protein